MIWRTKKEIIIAYLLQNYKTQHKTQKHTIIKIVKVMELEKDSGSTSLHALFQGLTMRLKRDDWKVVVRYKEV